MKCKHILLQTHILVKTQTRPNKQAEFKAVFRMAEN